MDGREAFAQYWAASGIEVSDMGWNHLTARQREQWDAVAKAGLRYEPVRVDREGLYIHNCGHVEWITDDERTEVAGGCDACESGSDQLEDWQPLFRVAK